MIKLELLVSLCVSTLPLLTANDQMISNGPCTVCQNGSSISQAKANYSVNIPAFGGSYTCGTLETLVPILLPQDNATECRLLQSVSSLCGCPTFVQNPCELCRDGEVMGYPSRQIDFLANLFGGFSVTCELLHAYIESSIPQDDTQCDSMQWLLSDYCGCGVSLPPATESGLNNQQLEQQNSCGLCADGESEITLPEKRLNITAFPLETCQQLADGVSTLLAHGSSQCTFIQQIGTFCGCPVPQDSCQLCLEDGPLAHPSRSLSFLEEDLNGLPLTCELLQSYTHSLKSNSQVCNSMIRVGGFCGCPPIQNHCDFCDGKPFPRKNAKKIISAGNVGHFGIDINFPLTCEVGVAMQYQLHEDEEFCRIGRTRQDICCDGEAEFGRADTRAKKLAYIWAPRVSSLLALLGSIAILQDVLRNKIKKRNVYNQIMAAMSCFDILYAMGTIFSSAPNDTKDASPIPGEIGNAITCKIQGFFIELGVTSVLYNMSLSTYYLFVIVLGWRNDKMKNVAIYLHLIPIIIGLSLSFAGIPFYGSTVFFCHVPTPPLADSWWPNIFLYFVPVYSAIVFHTLMMIIVYLKVWKQTNVARRWRFRDHPNIVENNQNQIPVEREAVSQGSSSSSIVTPGNSGGDVREHPEENVEAPSSAGHVSQTHSMMSRERRRIQQRVRRGARVEREVAWQAFFYVVAYVICWPVFSIAYANNFKVTSFWFYLVVVTLIPLQGFFNAIIYYRPRMVRALRKRRRERASLTTTLDETRAQTVHTRERGTIRHIIGASIGKLRLGISNQGDKSSYESNNADSVDIDLILEPSAMVADMNAFLEKDSLPRAGHETRNDLSKYLGNIKEELEEMDKEEYHIQPYEITIDHSGQSNRK